MTRSHTLCTSFPSKVVIRDNCATTLLYRFRYEGQLSRWTSYLERRRLKFFVAIGKKV